MGTACLREVVASVAQVVDQGGLPVVVLDVDSTLFDTAHRHHRILMEFAATRQEPWLMQLADTVAPSEFSWTVDGPLRARGIADPVLLGALQSFWAERFFDGGFSLQDLPIDGAVRFARALHKQGALLYYLTARPLAAMGEETVTAFLRWGFPVLGGRTVLHLKPTPEADDGAFKAAALDEVDKLQGTVVATFENDTTNAHHFLARWPDAIHVLLETGRSPTAPAPDPRLRSTGDLVLP